MRVSLLKAGMGDCAELYALQIACFRRLLEKYGDTDTNPGAEKPEKTAQRLAEPNSDYYFLRVGETNVGAVRVSDCGRLVKLKQIYILPEYQGHGYAQQAIERAEKLYPEAERWELDTILQESKLCYLYEKMGYRKTGRVEPLKDGMDLVFYAKSVKAEP